MADEAARRLLREWEASPLDQDLTAGLIAAFRRAGEPVPPEVLAARLLGQVLVGPRQPELSLHGR